MRTRRLLPAAAIAAVAPVVVGDYALYLLATIMALGIYAASYDLLFGYAGMLSLGHAVFYGVGGYAVAHTVTATVPGVLGSLALAVVVAGLLAVPLGAVAVRVSSHAFVLVTLLFVLVAELAATARPALTGGTDGIRVTAPTVTVPVAGEVALWEPVVQYLGVLVALVAVVLALTRIVETRFGLALRMVRENPDRAAALGYPVGRLRLAAFGVSGAFAGLAGGLTVLLTEHVSSGDFSITTTADPVVFTLLGGRGTLVGPVLGAGVIRGLGELLSGVTSAYPLLVGAAMVVVVVAAPEGLLGALRSARTAWRERR